MHEHTSDSVYFLISELCENLVKDRGNFRPNSVTSVRRLKAKSFEILLRKSNKCLVGSADVDPFRELSIRHFSAKINAVDNANKLTGLDSFQELMDFISNEPYFSEERGLGILQFLLHLDSVLKDESSGKRWAIPKVRLLVPGPFTLYANYKDNQHYPYNVEENIFASPQYFQGVRPIKNMQNPYLPRLLFHGDTNKLSEMDNKYASNMMLSTSNTFSGLASKFWGDSFRIDVSAFRLLKKQSNSSVKIIQSKSDTFRESSETLDNCKKLPEKKIFSWNWENLDCLGVPVEKPHVCETNMALDLNAIHNQFVGREFAAKVVSEEKFIRDLKSLTVGIQSDSFVHDEHILFRMVDNIALDDILPETLKNYVTDFIECGTCYKRLQIMIMKRNYKLMFEGFIFKALCSAIDEYLVTFRQFVFSVQNENLLNFYKRMKKMMKQISNLSLTLAIHPNVDANVKPPMGSQFLGYLYREIMRITERDFIMLLVFILRRCCHVYFKYLQKWLFYGVLDDPSSELFICYVDHYRPNTKYFYDKAYFVRKDSVPGFFQGYEDQVLQCGKYTMLLKAFKANHSLFNLDYPPMSVYLSFEDIQKLEETCNRYSEQAREICGPSITIRDVFQREWEAKRNFRTIASERSKANMDQWNSEQEAIALEYAEKRKKRHEELTLQLQDVKNRKIAERRANIELELKLLKDAQNLEDQRLFCDNINLKKRIEYYQELSDILDEQMGKKPVPSQSAVDTNENAKNAAATVACNTGTDYESCLGDDDLDSLYAECLTSDFEENFEKTEQEANENMQSNVNDNEKKQPPQPGMTLSASDYFNCNEIPTVVISDVERNRNRMLGSSSMGYCMTEISVKEVVALAPPKPLTDVQRNRYKILHDDYSIGGTEKADINSNPIETKSDSELTALQRNRKKMMQNDPFAEFNKDPLESRKHLNLDLNTERSRNKRKVLESEFHILTGTSKKPDLTPMSTTSDNIPNLTEADKESVVGGQLKTNEEVNDQTKISCDETLAAPATSEIMETPESALNTAGIFARQGFDFAQENDSVYETASDRQLSSTENVPAESRDPYQRCEELLKSNFKCQPMSPYFRLNYGTSNTPTTEQMKELLQQQRNLNSLSIITLTEFLQKSIFLPMSAHLEIINGEIMRVYLEDLKILDHFKSLRNYFFLMDGEFGSIICDGIIGRLESGATPAKLLNYQMLHSILDTALGSSITGNDKNADNLSFIVSDVPEKFDLSSPDVLCNVTLSYRIEWPLNLILNPETLDQYANIFKYLLKVRRISWVLEESYQILKVIVKKIGKKMLQSPQYIHVQQIRHKFYHFVHALKNHITSNALQASWKTFKDDLITAKTIEDIYRKHIAYVKRIMFLCMLNRRSAEFSNTIENIFKISLRFYGNLKSREWKLRPGEEHYTHLRYDKLVADEVAFEKQLKYTIYLGKKIVHHGYQEEIGEFIHLINYNQYYIVDN